MFLHCKNLCRSSLKLVLTGNTLRKPGKQNWSIRPQLHYTFIRHTNIFRSSSVGVSIKEKNRSYLYVIATRLPFVRHINKIVYVTSSEYIRRPTGNRLGFSLLLETISFKSLYSINSHQLFSICFDVMASSYRAYTGSLWYQVYSAGINCEQVPAGINCQPFHSGERACSERVSGLLEFVNGCVVISLFIFYWKYILSDIDNKSYKEFVQLQIYFVLIGRPTVTIRVSQSRYLGHSTLLLLLSNANYHCLCQAQTMSE